MVFGRKKQSNLITLVERKTRFALAIKNENRKSRVTALNIILGLKKYKSVIKSITFDQGSEFSDFGLIRLCLDSKVYFCTSGKPYEKGSK